MTGEGLRRVLTHALVATIGVVCVALGFWQLDRHRGLQERNALLEARRTAEPRSYDEVTVGLDADAALGADDDATHRPVWAEGTFDPDYEVLLRSRSYQEQPGYHVLTPLRLAGSAADAEGAQAVLVDRGWIPYRLDGEDGSSFAPPVGAVRVRGRLMPEEDPPEGFLAGLAPRDPETGELERVARADVERLEAQMPYRLESFLIEAESIMPLASGAGEDEGAAGDAGDGAPPAEAGVGGDAEDAGSARGADDPDPAFRGGDAALPIVPPPPEPEGGPHVGYAIQWFSFALIAVVGYGLLLRRTAREEREAVAGERDARPSGGG